MRLHWFSTPVSFASAMGSYFCSMAFTKVAKEVLALSPTERLDLAKLLIQSVAGDGQTDEEIKAELNRRLGDLVSSKDSGLSFDQVFGCSP
jgi:putative addiction module component (TIGR02574 family)